MVEIKLESRQIVFRVLYLGGEAAAKFATLRALQEELAEGPMDRITVLHAGGDRIVGFSYRPPNTPPVFGMQVTINALTIPGALNEPANEVLLLRAADAVVWLDDAPTTAESPAAFRALLQELRGTRDKPAEFPVFVQGRTTHGPAELRAYARPIAGFRPRVRSLDGNSTLSPALVLAEVGSEILDVYRRWERELGRKGLKDHIKIRDRIYERVCLTSTVDAEAALEPDPEVRMIPSTGTPSLGVPRWLLLALLAAVILAATLVSFML
ncbi:MAG: hypothetical protein KDB53_04955 [Planctomycetes bacterium]|nr:hypothetical protein [Planctomycetota bacterium]